MVGTGGWLEGHRQNMKSCSPALSTSFGCINYMHGESRCSDHNLYLHAISNQSLLFDLLLSVIHSCPLPLSKTQLKINTIMDSLPPNDPNNNNNNAPNSGSNSRSKEDALRPRTSGENENGDMEMFGDLQDNGFVVVMFLMSVAGWMLRERCVC